MSNIGLCHFSAVFASAASDGNSGYGANDPKGVHGMQWLPTWGDGSSRYAPWPWPAGCYRRPAWSGASRRRDTVRTILKAYPECSGYLRGVMARVAPLRGCGWLAATVGLHGLVRRAVEIRCERS